jgi:hypothetical protein
MSVGRVLRRIWPTDWSSRFIAILLLSWWALLLLFSPLILLYGYTLLCCVWFTWRREGRDVLVILADNKSSHKRMERISPLVGKRAEFLNWSERATWRRWKLGPQLFGFYSFFGPPPFARERSFPVVIVFRGLRMPRTFNFFGQSKNADALFDRLEVALAESGPE